MTRLLRIIVHNWPLKLAAIGLATLLYAFLVVAQDTDTFPADIPIRVENQPPEMFLLEEPPPVTSVRYLAREGAARPGPNTFQAWIDLSDVPETGGTIARRVQLTTADPNIQVIDWTPRTVEIRLDPIAFKIVPVAIDYGEPPPNVELGEEVSEPRTVTVTGPESLLQTVVGARASVVIQPSGINVDQDVALVPVDQVGNAVGQVRVDPSTARITIQVFTEPETRTMPINPVITGTPAAGFEVESVTVEPAAALVEGDADPLAAIAGLDTEPISISGLSETETFDARLALPDGIERVTDDPITVTVTFRAVTESRTFTTGVRAAGGDPALVYDLGADRVSLVVAGSPADLDALGAAGGPVGQVDVTGLEPGTYDLEVAADLPAGLTLVAATPETIPVTVAAPAAQAPSAAPSAAPPGS